MSIDYHSNAIWFLTESIDFGYLDIKVIKKIQTDNAI